MIELIKLFPSEPTRRLLTASIQVKSFDTKTCIQICYQDLTLPQRVAYMNQVTVLELQQTFAEIIL